eukprot:s8986_g2.t1
MRSQRNWRPVPTDSGTKAEVAVLWSQESVLVWLSGTQTDEWAGQGHRHLLDPCALCWGLEAPSWRASTVALAPGIKLPPTLIFDYPSVAAITEFVMDQSKMIAG